MEERLHINNLMNYSWHACGWVCFSIKVEGGTLYFNNKHLVAFDTGGLCMRTSDIENHVGDDCAMELMGVKNYNKVNPDLLNRLAKRII